MRRAKPTPASTGINGTIRHVYDGPRSAGYIVERAPKVWKAVANGGCDVGLFESAPEAARAVLAHHRVARAAH